MAAKFTKEQIAIETAMFTIGPAVRNARALVCHLEVSARTDRDAFILALARSVEQEAQAAFDTLIAAHPNGRRT
jgi:hypothetical protein